MIILFIKYKSLNSNQFSNKIKNFVLSLEQKRRLYFAICSIVYSATKQNSIKVPQDAICTISDGDITGTTFEEAKADISMVKRQVYALTQALISAGIINNSQVPQ